MACYNGECCVYDSLGNPTMYRCHSLEWTRARKLAGFDANTFKYNASGIRFKKNNTVYTLAGTKILKETTGSNTITYYYGTGVAPIGFNYNGTNYYFRKNIQGDVVAIYDKWGFAVAKYVYDAWGNHKIYDEYGAEVISTNHIGYINPIRYRGYYFDVETNLYYLQTRYYDPETGRFLNSDAIEYLNPEQLGGLNLYAYCGNNPIICVDYAGTSFFCMLILAMVAGATVGAMYGGITAATKEQDVVHGIITGALSGAVMGAGAAVASAAIAPVIAGATSVTLAGTTISAGVAIATGTATAFVSGMAGGFISETSTQMHNSGEVSDWKSVSVAMIEWGILNTASAYLCALPGPLSDVQGTVLSLAYGHIVSPIGIIIDIFMMKMPELCEAS